MTIRLLRGREVAEMLEISETLAYKSKAEGTVPSIKFGRNVRVRQEDLEALIALRASGIAADPLNARPAAETASPDEEVVNPDKRKVSHVR